MTMVWPARLALRGDLDRVLCGRQVAGRYVCDAVLARRYVIDTAEGRASSSMILIPDGLTDQDERGKHTGEYRWSSYAQHRADRGEHADRDKRAGAPQPRAPGLAGTAAIIANKGPKGFRRLVATPTQLPCRYQHLNRVDETLLKP
jgi:hypothetical protein